MEKAVLITGGTGSLGREIVKQLLESGCESIRILSRNEANQVIMQREFNSPYLRFFIGDIRDKDRLWRSMKNVDIVIHTAALKHVPVCEYNPIEAVKTNIMGAVNIVEAALDRNIEKVMAISSDKAVNPINIYGATKFAMEKLFIDANVYGGKFSCVRMGNLEGSSGSVIPLFKEQAENGEVTMTDPNMRRLYLKIDEAARFILNCIRIMEGGEIFVPEMQEIPLIETVANAIGDKPVTVKIIGKRAGEKLFECPFNEDEFNRIKRIEGGYIIK